MSHSVRSHLRLEVDAYDDAIRQFIPGYEEGLNRIAGEVAAVRPALALDLGAGTGALAEAMLEHESVGVVEAIDVDPEMLDRARIRLKRFGSRVRFRECSFEAPLPACDAVAACLALHHIPAMQRKRAMYRHIFRALRPGGVFVTTDVTMTADPEERERRYRVWTAHLVSRGIGERRAREHFDEWAAEDTYFPVEDELTAMRDAGFVAECAVAGPAQHAPGGTQAIEFRMGEYLQRYLHAADRALANYDIGEVCIAERKPVGHIGFSGYSMVKFRAEAASGRCLVTVYYAEGDRDIRDCRKAIRSHLLWLEALDRDTDLVVQKPVHSLSGDYVTGVQSDRDPPVLVTLLRWVDGELVWDNYGDEAFVDLPSGILRDVGAVLGKLHRHSSLWTLPEGFTRPEGEPDDLQLNLNRLRPAADDGRIGAGDFAVLERTVCRVIEHVADMDGTPQFLGMLHGDFSCGNCVAHRGEISPIDFDWCRFGHFLADVGWCFAVNPMSPTLCQAFLDGYVQQFPFPDNHLRTIESFFIESCIRLLSWRAEDPGEEFPSLPRFVECACRKYLEGEAFVLDWMEEL